MTARSAAAPQSEVTCYEPGCIVYRMVDLGPIAPPGAASGLLDLPPTGLLSFGINASGAIVFNRIVAGDPRATVWIPPILASSYGLASQAPHDLHTLAGLSDDVTVATDINDGAVAIGAAGEGLPVWGETDPVGAFVWRIGVGSPPAVVGSSIHPTELEFDSTSPATIVDTGCLSVAFGITDDSDPRIAGAATIDCLSNGCGDQDPFRGFSRTLSQTTTPLGHRPSGNSFSSWALAIDGSGTAFGFDDGKREPNSECESAFVPFVPCEPQHLNLALAWLDESDATALDLIETPGPGDLEARDCLPDGTSVGSGFATIGSGCGFQAGIWSSPTASPVNIGVVYDEDLSSKAEAIAALGDGDLVVVGGDPALLDAIVWLRLDNDWCANRIFDISAPPVTLAGVSTISQILWAHDVNGRGFIITHAPVVTPSVEGATTSLHAILLTCPTDFDGSMAIDSADLAILLGAWGTCGSDCAVDLTFDGEIDAADLAILLGAWSGPGEYCSIGGEAVLCPETSESFFASGRADLLGPGLALLGFESADELAAWAPSASDAELAEVGAFLHSLLQ